MLQLNSRSGRKVAYNDEALEQLLADAITKVNLKNEC